MSHIVQAKTRITYPDLEAFLRLSRQGDQDAIAQLPFIRLLQQAVLMVAREHGGTVETSYLDYYRQPHTTNTGIALRIPRQKAGQPALERGMGLCIDEETGALTFIGDPYRVEEYYERLQRQIVQTYAALAYSVAMRLENYQQVTVQVRQDQLVVSGECYA